MPNVNFNHISTVLFYCKALSVFSLFNTHPLFKYDYCSIICTIVRGTQNSCHNHQIGSTNTEFLSSK